MVPRAVLILQDPDARTASRPTETPALTLLAGTLARTRSPVRTPPTTLVALGPLSGNPAALVRHIWRLCRPMAVISRGTTPAVLSRCGVLSPTQAASSQWVLGRSRVVRFHFVRPPVPVSRGNPNVA